MWRGGNMTTYQDECIVSLVRDEIVKHCQQNIGTIEGCAKAIKNIVAEYGEELHTGEEFDAFSCMCQLKDLEEYSKDGLNLCRGSINKGCSIWNCPRLTKNQKTIADQRQRAKARAKHRTAIV
jgi:predicted AAA+ superfamily ATPase